MRDSCVIHITRKVLIQALCGKCGAGEDSSCGPIEADTCIDIYLRANPQVVLAGEV